MQGLATAAGSASVIRELCRLAKVRKGRVYLVDAPTAEHGRRRIAAFRSPIVTCWCSPMRAVLPIAAWASTTLGSSTYGSRLIP
jgi:hypothetical protein